MKQIKCEMCGSTDIVKQDGVYLCQICGMKYSVEEAKSLMIEGQVDVSGSTVKVDTSDELANLYTLARRAKDDNNSELAQKYYEQIIVKDPSSWEATFYTTYYQSMNCKIGEIYLASVRISNCEKTVFNLIKENINDPDERMSAVDEVAARLIIISKSLFNSYKKHYDDFGSDVIDVQEYLDTCLAARDIVYDAGNLIIELFGEDYGKIAAACWEAGVYQHNILCPLFAKKQLHAYMIKEYTEKIKKYKPEFKDPETKNEIVQKNKTVPQSELLLKILGGFGIFILWLVFFIIRLFFS